MKLVSRSPIIGDQKALLLLYRRVAAQGNGIARNLREISANHISSFMRQSLKTGWQLVIEHPTDSRRLIADIHCYGYGLAICHHVLPNLTLAVDPDFQGQGLGKLLLNGLLDHIRQQRTDIMRLELLVFQSNQRAIHLYQQVGFQIEAVLPKRVRLENGQFTDDVMMVWFNPAYGKTFSSLMPNNKTA